MPRLAYGLLAALVATTGPYASTTLTATLTHIQDTPPTAPAFAAQLPTILNGLAYIDFHTTQFGSGEIRGQILAAVPEPETYALMLGGLGAAFLARRRRK